MKKMRLSNRITYLYSIYNGTRMLIGAINSLFLLSRGVSLGNIAFLQMIHTITVLCMEIPTGVIADAVSRKLSVLLSCGMLVLYYPLVYLSAPNMVMLCISQVVYALSLCLISGAFEGWQASIVKKEFPDEDDKLNYYGHMKYEMNSFITMFSGTAGSVIVYLGGGQYFVLYFICAISMIFLLYAFSRIPHENVVKLRSGSIMKPAITTYIDELKQGFKSCFSNIHGWCYFFGISFLACTYQVVFYYWQPYFTQLAGQKNGYDWLIRSNELLLGLVFFVYSFSRFIMNRIVRLKLLGKIEPFKIAMICLIIASFCTVGFTCFHGVNIFIHIILFAIIQGTITLVESIFESQFIKKTKEECISSSLSISSAATSILSIGILFIISKTITEETMHLFFLSTIVMYAMLVIVLVVWNRKYHTKEVKSHD